MKRKGWMQVIVGLVLVMSFSAGVMAQQPGQGPGGFGQGQGRGQQGFGQQGQPVDIQQAAQQYRKAASDRIKEELGSTEEEWAILGPKIEKIQGLNTDVSAGISGTLRLFGGARRGGGGGGGIGGLNARSLQTLMGGSSAMAQKMQDLQDAIDSPTIAESEIKTRLAAVRAERVRVREELAKARAELTQLLTQRQEAILFTMGILE